MRVRYFIDSGTRTDVFEVERSGEFVTILTRGDDDRLLVRALSVEEAQDLAAALAAAVEGGKS